MGKVGLESRVLSFVQRHKLIPRGETLVVGVSGGADSVCLLHLLAEWRQKLRLKLHAAHLDHQLRGAESEADARYVVSLADSLGVPVTVGRRDVNAYRDERNCSLEEAARELRYDFLAAVAGDVGAARVAVGHTRDDQVETILLHILRGAGTAGLCGIKPCSPLTGGGGEAAGAPRKQSPLLAVRPLLELSREETMRYCQEHQLQPRSDSSNLSPAFLRNRLRLQLLPLLREYNPGVDRALLRLAEIADADVSFIEEQARQMWDGVAREEGGVIYLDKKKVASLPLALQRQVIRVAIARISGNTRDIEANHVEAVRGLVSAPRGKSASLPRPLICRSEYNEIIIAREDRSSADAEG
jgi:tRNA(Ile)-lysidine synthase